LCFAYVLFEFDILCVIIN